MWSVLQTHASDAWPDAALTPRYLRSVPAESPPIPDLDTIDNVRSLTDQQARSLTGAQIDVLSSRGLMDALGNRWLMREQECDYKHPRDNCRSRRRVVHLVDARDVSRFQDRMDTHPNNFVLIAL